MGTLTLKKKKNIYLYLIYKCCSEAEVGQHFSTSAALRFGAGYFCVVGAALCIAGCLAVSLTATPKKPVAAAQLWQKKKKWPQTLPNIPRGAKSPRLRTSRWEGPSVHLGISSARHGSGTAKAGNLAALERATKDPAFHPTWTASLPVGWRSWLVVLSSHYRTR